MSVATFDRNGIGTAAAPLERSTGSRSAKKETAAKPVHVLILNDSRATRLVLKNFMLELGYQVTEAENGLEALGCLEGRAPVDLVLADWEMPLMNGVEFVRSVRGNPTHSHIPVVMVADCNTHSGMVEALNAGVNEYVMKPFTREIIAEKLELLTIQHQQPSQLEASPSSNGG